MYGGTKGGNNGEFCYFFALMHLEGGLIVYIGIDPGQKGGIAVLSKQGSVLDAVPMPDAFVLADILESHVTASKLTADQRIHCFLERVGSMPGQGVRSMFTFGESYGMVQGILITLRVPYTLVSPFTWQRSMWVGINRKSLSTPKQRSLRAVRQLFPDLNVIPNRCRVPHDGIVDAVLIAEYGRRSLLCESLDQNPNKSGKTAGCCTKNARPNLKLCDEDE